ncbi:MAG: nucleoside-triphosphatase [Erysipelotrichaceae bacterium]|nr:nucleoside-triphosphatase [Erysipelotrichaceae bacterium]MDY5251644.1 nucleoside-triphosphatase [Erysipelotrichaceae bacterium]
MKIFITGSKGSGKSTLVNKITKSLALDVSGFVTLPRYEDGERIGFYFHSLVEIADNDQQFSQQKPYINEVIPGILDDLGVRCLKASQGDRYIIMDEIGYLEHDEKLYLAALEETIQNNANILGVLRQCAIEYIQKIKARNDIVLLDLDELSFDEAYEMIFKQMKGKI